ncbi:hypothetical protein [Methanosarcina sp.]|nr:hypothetical protein [Methanosarcina sp.]MDY9925699.1 hypothetical protein [Methanosarcina sp.]
MVKNVEEEVPDLPQKFAALLSRKRDQKNQKPENRIIASKI